MISQKQLEANQANSLKSTGPRTPEGKTIVSKNSLKHGLLSSEVLLEEDSKEQFEQFGEGLMMDLSPEGALECMLADRIIAAAWRLRRAMKIERQMMEYDVDTLGGRGEQYKNLAALMVGAESRSEEEKPPVTLGMAVSSDLVKANTYGKFSRYEAHIERGLYKALHELQRLQAARRGQPVTAPLALDVDVSGVESRAG